MAPENAASSPPEQNQPDSETNSGKQLPEEPSFQQSATTGNSHAGAREGEDLLPRFLAGISTESTRRVYRRGVELFRDFLGESAMTADAARRASREMILLFLHCRMEEESENTARSRATALRAFFQWLQKEDLLETLPFRTEEGSATLLEAARRDRGAPRLEDLPSDFFETRRWLENPFNQDLSQELDFAGEGLSLPLFKVPVAADSIFAHLWHLFHDGDEAIKPRSLVLRIDHAKRPLGATLRLDPASVVVYARIAEKTLCYLREEGAGPAFQKRPVLEALAFLYERDWNFPGPLFDQLQLMAEEELDSSRRVNGGYLVPIRRWMAVNSSDEFLHRQATRSVASVLTGGFGVSPGEETVLTIQRRPSRGTFKSHPRDWEPATGTD